ncbi:hypothetical protein AAFF_G00304960 [Aldrovandia affinis]|uniref:Uncharacterized protein n=1 Tax=Aldrovandia affinis TaxID=143900 RepID=A0AAD7SPB0_9TELE|nr:hypothetical protein AAFF_G00304960 [Aldrovandia affinis]
MQFHRIQPRGKILCPHCPRIAGVIPPTHESSRGCRKRKERSRRQDDMTIGADKQWLRSSMFARSSDDGEGSGVSGSSWRARGRCWFSLRYISPETSWMSG